MTINETKLRERISFKPFKEQEEILACNEREVTISCGRRFGKSAICGYLALKTLLQPNKKIWIVAPTYDLTNKVFEYVVRFLIKVAPEAQGAISYRPYPRIKFLTSTLEGRSAENSTGLLGEEVDLLIVDEASRIPRHIYDTYLYPVTSTRQGRIILISTPFGKNWFYEHWIEAKSRGAAFNFSSKQSPYFPKEEWEYAKTRLPEMVFRQEYEAVFLEDAATVFRGVHEIVGDTLRDAIPERHYLMGVDLARVNDFTVLTIVDSKTHDVVYWERLKDLDYTLQKVRIKAAADRYNKARLIVDSTGLGDPISEDLRQAGYVVDDIKISKKTKSQLIEKLMLFIERKAVRIPQNEVLIDELTSYAYHVPESNQLKAETVRYGALSGKHDDCVISLALAVWGQEK